MLTHVSFLCIRIINEDTLKCSMVEFASWWDWIWTMIDNWISLVVMYELNQYEERNKRGPERECYYGGLENWLYWSNRWRLELVHPNIVLELFFFFWIVMLGWFWINVGFFSLPTHFVKVYHVNWCIILFVCRMEDKIWLKYSFPLFDLVIFTLALNGFWIMLGKYATIAITSYSYFVRNNQETLVQSSIDLMNQQPHLDLQF